MLKACLAFGAAATLASAGLVHAAGLPVETALEARHAQGAGQGIGWVDHQKLRPIHYQFDIRPSWEEALGGTVPGLPLRRHPSSHDRDAAAVLQAPAGAEPVDTPLARSQTPVPVEQGSPFHAYLMSAGQYVLDVGTLAEAQPSQGVSAVPLPGALWLFASALVAFLGISSRHKL